MPQHTTLVATIVAGLTAAYLFGALAHRLKVSPLVGYLVAGVLVGPFTPGFVADAEIATELAEIGVILLMFGVGLHFSLRDLLSVRSIAIPGAVVQIAVATLMGMGLGYVLGWPPVGGFVFGLALSVASTVVLLRALQERRIVQTERGRIAVGWLIVEDLAMVLTLVLLPALASAITAQGSAGIVSAWIVPLALTFGKVAAFIAFMLIVGRRVIPWMLHWTAHTGSRELFRLAVLAIALGVAFGAAALFDVSFALGAFFAGLILAESELSQRAAEETIPLRDAFAVLFFVSVGMLFNPNVVVEQPWALLATVAIIVIGKSVAAYGIVRLFRHDRVTALTISASLAQIGEFSFILAALGVSLGLLPEDGRDLILAGAIISIMLNPFVFNAAARRARPVAARIAETTAAPAGDAADDLQPTGLSEHVILVGFGRVGAAVARSLEQRGQPFVVIDVDRASQRRARDAGLIVRAGNAADPAVLEAAGIARAARVMIAIPDGFEAGGVVQEARRCNPHIEIVARAHSAAEVEHLVRLGADRTILGEQELAEAMVGQLRPAHPVIAPPPSAPTPPATAPRLILNDPEWTLLAAAREIQLKPGQSIMAASLVERAARMGAIAGSRLEEAVPGLVQKGCLSELPGGEVRLTPEGYLAAASAPAP